MRWHYATYSRTERCETKGIILFAIDGSHWGNCPSNGDKILFLTAKIIQAILNQRQQTDTFLGHIGGDDFVAVVYNENIAGLCEEIIVAFDQQVGEYYNEKDRNQGYIISKNRHGFDEQFPLVAISIGVVTGKKNSFRNHFQLGEAASLVKKRCKLTWTSCYHIA